MMRITGITEQFLKDNFGDKIFAIEFKDDIFKLGIGGQCGSKSYQFTNLKGDKVYSGEFADFEQIEIELEDEEILVFDTINKYLIYALDKVVKPKVFIPTITLEGIDWK